MAFLLPWSKPKDRKVTLGRGWRDTDPLTEKQIKMGSRARHCKDYDMAGRCCIRSAPSKLEYTEEESLIKKHTAFLAKLEEAECRWTAKRELQVLLTFFIGAVMRLNCFPELLMPSRQQRLCDKAILADGLPNWGRRSPGSPDLHGALETAGRIVGAAHLRIEHKLKKTHSNIWRQPSLSSSALQTHSTLGSAQRTGCPQLLRHRYCTASYLASSLLQNAN